MVRDVLIDIKEHDILLDDKSSKNEPLYKGKWFSNKILIDTLSNDRAVFSFDANNSISFRFNISYIPQNIPLRISITTTDGETQTTVTPSVYAYLNGSSKESPINACQIPLIDIDGDCRITYKKDSSKAYIYSAKELDLMIGASDNQSAQLLAICAPGKNYRYPTTGIDVTKYLNSVVNYSDLQYVIEKQYNADGKTIHDAEFDNATGTLNTRFSAEYEQEEKQQLTPISELNVDSFKYFTDNNINSLLNIDKREIYGFQSIFNIRNDVLSILLFKPNASQITRIDTSHNTGRLNIYGGFVPGGNSYVVSGDVCAGDIIAFNMPNIGENELMFFQDTLNVSEEYLSYSRYSNPNFLKCAVITKDCKLMYTIPQSAYNNGDGLYYIHETGHNIRNLVTITSDGRSGRNVGIVSELTDIDDDIINELIESFNE